MKSCNYKFKYSFEILPWSIEKIENYNDLLNRVIKLKERPMIPKRELEYDNITKYFINMLKECWNEDIKKRPTISEILNSLNDHKLFLK
jgi:hypothetical protein